MNIFRQAYRALSSGIEGQGYRVVTTPGTDAWGAFMAEIGAERFPAFTLGHDPAICEQTCLSITVQRAGVVVAGIAVRRYAVGDFDRWLSSGRMFFGPVECLDADFEFFPPTHDNHGEEWPEIWGGVHVRGGNFVVEAHRGRGIGSRLSLMALAAGFLAFHDTDHSIGLRHVDDDATVERVSAEPVYRGLNIGKAEADFWLTHSGYAETVKEFHRRFGGAGNGEVADAPVLAQRWHA